MMKKRLKWLIPLIVVVLIKWEHPGECLSRLGVF